MAYKTPYIDLEMSGTLALGLEIWTCGIHFAAQSGTATEANLQAAIDDQASNAFLMVAAFHAQTNSLVPGDVHLTEVKLSVKDTAGKTVGEPDIAQGNVSGSRNGGYAPQNCLAVTMSSDKPRDPGRYNRFYYPLSVSAIGDAPFLNTQQQTDYANNVATLLTNLNNLFFASGGALGIVASAVSGTREGFDFPITKVGVGQIIDTQQKRRNKLIENRLDVPVPTDA